MLELRRGNKKSNISSHCFGQKKSDCTEEKPEKWQSQKPHKEKEKPYQKKEAEEKAVAQPLKTRNTGVAILIKFSKGKTYADVSRKATQEGEPGHQRNNGSQCQDDVEE